MLSIIYLIFIFLHVYTDIDDVQNVTDPLNKVTPGLILEGGKKSVPLRAVHVRARLLDMIGQVRNWYH